MRSTALNNISSFKPGRVPSVPRVYLLLAWFIAAGACMVAAAPAAEPMTSYETPYYTIHSDLPPDLVREASVRMTKMAEEYRARTRDFSGDITERMPFYLYASPDDYYASGAPKDSAGYFNGKVLAAIAGELSPRTWAVIQHEGFHQFARSVIRGKLPVWVNEGLAEYFAEGIFTGDGFVTGVIPQWRLARVRQTFKSNRFRPLDEMMELTHAQWNADLAIVNYDQGWSMVQFLAHGEHGRYQRAFGAFMGKIAQDDDPHAAWQEAFGASSGFEQHWHDYWMNLPDNPTLDLYVRGNVATLSSFLARAVSQRQSFAGLDAFMKAADEGGLKSDEQDWLPPGLLKAAITQMNSLKKLGCSYSLESRPGERPQIVCRMKDGTKITGKFTLREARVTSVWTDAIKGK